MSTSSSAKPAPAAEEKSEGASEGYTLDTIKFDNRVLRELPIDPIKENYCRPVPGAIFSRVRPGVLENPKLVAASPWLFEDLGIKTSELKRDDVAAYFSGNKLFPGADPAAHCYCGHQFGVFAGQLGDGAAMYLGEIVGKGGKRWEIQFKGAGPTPYSRSSDGRKVLRSSLREYLCSEAMHFLGVPTTRAAALVTSDSRIARDPVYSGKVVMERCTVVTRVAETFFRFGSFEIFKDRDELTGRSGPSSGPEYLPLLEKLLDYIIQNYYPEIAGKYPDKEEQRLKWFAEVVKRTAELVAHWQAVGWTHGVLNTDNMSIVGLTIDYGPYGFQDYFVSDLISNGSDDGGRYTYENQPFICKWNCIKLSEALSKVIPAEKTRAVVESSYSNWYSSKFLSLLRSKLGLLTTQEGDLDFINSLFITLDQTGADFLNTFLILERSIRDEEIDAMDLANICCSAMSYKKRYAPRIPIRQLRAFQALKREKPEVFETLDPQSRELVEADLERLATFEKLEDYDDSKKSATDREVWTNWLKKYYERLELDLKQAIEQKVSEDSADWKKQHAAVMQKSNPRIILRNWMAQRAIEKAEDGDFSEVNKLLKALTTPFSADTPAEYTGLPPDWAEKICVTCSS